MQITEILSSLHLNLFMLAFGLWCPQKFTTYRKKQDFWKKGPPNFSPWWEAAYKRIDRVFYNLDRLIGDGWTMFKKQAKTLCDAIP